MGILWQGQLAAAEFVAWGICLKSQRNEPICVLIPKLSPDIGGMGTPQRRGEKEMEENEEITGTTNKVVSSPEKM